MSAQIGALLSTYAYLKISVPSLFVNQINWLVDLNCIAFLPAVNVQPVTVKLKPDAKPMFFRAPKVLLAWQDQESIGRTVTSRSQRTSRWTEKSSMMFWIKLCLLFKKQLNDKSLMAIACFMIICF